MKRAARIAGQTAAGGLAGVSAVAAGMSWHVLAVAAVTVLFVVAAVCWVITDNGRTRRLATLIHACHGAGQPAAKARDQHARRF
jgi:hypothetical protein